MQQDTFDLIVNTRFNKCKAILQSKATEYSRNDRLSNFKRAGQTLQTTPEKALVGMWIKHIISCLDMVDDLDKGVLWDMSVWDEKITDIINYCVLLETLIIDNRRIR